MEEKEDFFKILSGVEDEQIVQSLERLYNEEKRQSEVLNVLLDILIKRDFLQLIRLLPEQIATIFQATVSLFLIDSKREQDALVLQGTNNKMLKNRIGWIHYLPGEGTEGWVGKTAQRLLDVTAPTERAKIKLPHHPEYPELKSPYRSCFVPLVARDEKPFGVLWLARPGEELPFADKDEKLLQEISGRVAKVIEHENLRGRIQNAGILEALQNVRMQIRSDITPDEILQLILEQAAKLSDANNGTLGVVNQKTRLLKVRAACGSLRGVEIQALAEKDKGITRYVVDTGIPYLCQDVTKDSHYLKSDPKTLSELCVPIKVGGQTIGDINLESEEKEYFSLEHKRLLTLFAVYAGAAIVMAQPRLTNELQTLLDIGQELLLISSIDVQDEVLGRVVFIVADTLPCKRISIWLKDATGKRIVLRAAFGEREKFIGELFYDLDVIDESGMKGEGLTGKVATGSIKKICTRAAREIKGWKGKYNKPDEGHPEQPGSVPMMILPLRTPNDNIIGAIRFTRPYPREDHPEEVFNESDERFAIAFAQQIAAVLSAYLFFDKLQTLADINELLLTSSPENLDEMLTKAAFLAAHTLQCERISIWLKDTTGKRIVLRAACGGREKFIGQQFYDLDVIDKSGMRGEGLTGKIASGSIEKIRTRAAREMKGWKGKFNQPNEGHDESPGSVPMMILPLRTMNEIVGSIRFTRPYYRTDRPDGCFNDNDERFALAVAQLIAIAVEIARLFEEKQRGLAEAVHLNEIWNGYRRSAEERRVKFRCDCPLDLTVEVDAQMFREAFSNLVANALKFTPDSTYIIVRAQQMEDNVEIKMFDQGPGLSSEVLERCFELYFSTVPPGGKREGQGLGLFIARRIVHLHKGNLHASNKGRGRPGAVFTITLPQGDSNVNSNIARR